MQALQTPVSSCESHIHAVIRKMGVVVEDTNDTN